MTLRQLMLTTQISSPEQIDTTRRKQIHAFCNDSLGDYDTMALKELLNTKQASAKGLVASAIGRARRVNPSLNAIATERYSYAPANAETSHRAPTRKPRHTDYSSGASSGGSAARVASGVVPVAHANDGGGSIRMPAGLDISFPTTYQYKYVVLFLLATTLSFSLPAIGNSYRCVKNGKTYLSHQACEESARSTEADTTRHQTPGSPTQYGKSIQKTTGKVTEETTKNKRRKILEQAIARNKSDLTQIQNQFNIGITKLEKQLAEAKSEYDHAWNEPGLKNRRNELYDKVRSLKNRIKKTRRQFYTEKKRIDDKNRDLKKELRSL